MSNLPLTPDDQDAIMAAEEKAALHRGRCLWSGLGLYPWPNDGAWPGNLACWPCDCGGYTPEEVRAEN